MNSPESREPNDSDIAIVGMALRVPGARNPREYWQNLCNGVESVRDFTEEELIAAGESQDNLRRPNYVRRGGVLADMEMFDGEFFGFSPKESAILDPQHRHFMECAWEALEDAGHIPEKFDGSIGLFGGCGMGSYFYFNVCTHRELLDSVGLFLLRHTGNDKDFLVTRVSYLLDLKGPSINVQTACSTSLVATHLACQSLLSGECDMALAGGVTIEIPHGRGYLYREGEVLSPDGHCHAFDHRGQGTVLTSGVGVVALRRLGDALADGDHVYAVIKGSAVNNDGAGKVGYLAPSVDGQAAAMVEAYSVAGVNPETIGYVECHGTGTYMGDPIEIAALTQAFRKSTQRSGFCRIGSVKTSIGHLDTAAGVASLIKAALALEHGKIPASLNFEKPNPAIDFATSPFVVNDQLWAWQKSGKTPRRAAVNSLGVGGTNAHVVLEEPPRAAAGAARQRPYTLLTLSGRNVKALDGNSARLAQFLRENPDVPLGDVAFTLHEGRRAFEKRRVLAARDHEEAARLLEQADMRRVFTHTAVDGKAQLAFMFSGGGSQYPRMGADLYDSEPVFREHVDRGLELLRTRSGIDLRPLIFAPKSEIEQAAAKFEPTPLQLPAIFIIEYALAQLWMSWGAQPVAMIGHSLGENTAACLAGVIAYADAVELLRLRGELVDRTAAGAMLSVQLSPEELAPLLSGEVDLGTVNAPQLCVASGARAAIEALEGRLRERGVESRRLPIPVGGHSRMLDPILPEFERYLRSIELNAPKIPFVSNRTGTWITTEQARDPRYWVEHLRHTVRFADGIGTLLEEPNRVLLEVGPGQTLCSLARQHPSAKPTTPIVPSLRHRDEEVSDSALFLTNFGRLWAAGVSVPIARLWEGEQRRRVPLPTYAFAHQRYFIEPAARPRDEETLDRLPRIEAVENWGFKPVWIDRPVESGAESKPETWLLFMDDAGVGARLSRALKGRGHTVIEVHDGDAYHRRSDTEYTLSPERGRTGYDALVRDLMASGRAPSRIVHLSLVTAAERFRPGSSFFHRNLEHGFYSLFFLAQALGDENVPRPLHLTVVSSGMQQVGDERLRYPEKAAALGPCKVIPRELTGITCSSVDIALRERGAQLFGEILGNVRRSLGQNNGHNGHGRIHDVVEQLERELLSEPANAVVAYRGGRRWLQSVERQRLAPVGDLPAPLRMGGVYLITGGLGGIGLTMAEMLAARAHAKLVLIARNGLPEQGEWDAWLGRRGPSDAVSRKILQVRALEAAGAEVMVAAADVTNLEQMRGVIEAAHARFGALNGVLHAAGVVKDALIQMKTELDVEDVFAPKVHGTLVLDALLRDLDLDFFVLFSSTSAIAAPPGQIDYVAANAFLDAHARARSAGGTRTRTVAINWGIWNGVGLASQAFGGDAGAYGRVERVGPAEHPLFEERLRDERGRSVLRSVYSPKTHWILDEHRTGTGHALIPGTGFLELARAALEAIGEPGEFEIRDLFFIRPLAVRDDELKEARVVLQRSEEGYTFEVRTKCQFEGRAGWELHAQARLLLHRLTAPAAIDVAAIDRRCQRRRSPLHPEGMRSPQEVHLRFGPRWRVLQQVSAGDGEALALLQLPASFAADLEHFKLHPALMDIATGYAMELISGYAGDDLWVPVSYGSARVYGKLPRRVHSWVRVRGDNRAGSDFALFDVTITDPEGRPVVEVAEFAIKRMRDQVAFTASSAPSRAEVELEATGGDRDLSPAEQRLFNNYGQGIRAQEGADALLRVLAGEAVPQVGVSSLDVGALQRQLEQVPTTGAGSGTKFERPELDSDYVAPHDELERTLVGFWEELLGVDKVGVQDSFFDLGGHSLIAVRLFAMIKKTYQVEFPISVLFEAPTIERCAKLIRDVIGERSQQPDAAAKPSAAQPRSRFRHLVAMHPGEGGPKAPFFLVAGMFGNVLNLRHLAHLLGTDRPFYGLQARGLYGDEQPHATFEEMAAAYIEEMIQVQPRGPYYLGGFSGGGITAFEMARQLHAAGHEVAALVMLDSRLPQTPPITPRDRALIQIQRLQRQGPSYLARWVRGRMQWELEKLQTRFGGEDEVAAPTPDQFQNDAIERAFRAALPLYRMQRFSGRISLFRPKLDRAYVLGPDRFLSSEREWVYPDNGWGPWADQVDVHEVPGDHDSMVLEPNVRVLAAQLRKCIESADARAVSAAAAASPSESESARSYAG